MMWGLVCGLAVAGPPRCTAEGGAACAELAAAADTLGRARRAARLRARACTAIHPMSCEALHATDDAAAHRVVDLVIEDCEAGRRLTGCHEAANWLHRGPTPHRDPARAERLLARACDGGIGATCVVLGRALEDGRPTEARERYRQACEASAAGGCRALAWHRMQGAGGPLDVEGAYLALQTACEGHDADACRDLAQWHEKGRGRPADPRQAAAAWTEACRHGAYQCGEAAAVVRRGPLADHAPELREMLQKHCAAGAWQACGGLYFFDPERTADLVATSRHNRDLDITQVEKAACEEGHAGACLARVPDARPTIARQLRLHAEWLRRMTQPRWPAGSEASTWRPELGALQRCLERHVAPIADPALGGRQSGSPGYVRAATMVHDTMVELGLTVRREPVRVPIDEPSWITADGAVIEARPVPGAPGGTFSGRVRVLDAPPSGNDLANLDEAAVVFGVDQLEDGALPFVPARVPTLAVGRSDLVAIRGATRVEGRAQRDPGVLIDNVIGVWPGRGALAAEQVLLGAHLDGQGRDLDGAVRPGADDNASGVAGLLCAAEALVAYLADAPDRRTLVFAAFGGEEQGLFGSRAYVANADPLPVAMIDLDMIGRLGDADIGVEVFGTGWEARLGPVAKALGRGVRVDPGEGTSDHFSFGLAGVPAILLWSGEHGDYHTETDTVDRLDFRGATDITGLAGAVLAELAGGPAPAAPVSDPCTEFLYPKLGVGLAIETMDHEAAVVRCVPATSAGAAYGIRRGDVILSWQGRWPIAMTRVFVRRGAICLKLEIGRGAVSRACDSVEIH